MDLGTWSSSSLGFHWHIKNGGQLPSLFGVRRRLRLAWHSLLLTGSSSPGAQHSSLKGSLQIDLKDFK